MVLYFIYIMYYCFCRYGFESNNLIYCIVIVFFCYIFNNVVVFIYVKIYIKVRYGYLFWIEELFK